MTYECFVQIQRFVSCSLQVYTGTFTSTNEAETITSILTAVISGDCSYRQLNLQRPDDNIVWYDKQINF